MNSRRSSFLFDRWPRFAARHPWRVIGALGVAIALLALVAIAFPGRYTDNFSIPGTESQRLVDLLEERFPRAAGDSATVVVRAPAGLNDAAATADLERLLTHLQELPEVVSVSSPFDTPGSTSADGSIARINVQYEAQAFELRAASVDALAGVPAAFSTPNLQVEVGGRVVQVAERELPGKTELIGLGAAVVILVVAFGSVVAMSLPIVVALLSLAAGIVLVGVGSSYLDLPSFTPQFGAMIGLGAGIDYALLIVTRFREGLALGLGVEDAIVRASATAGRAVLLAGATVVIALLGSWAVGIPALAYASSAAGVVVAASVVVALLVLPALLRLVGTRIDRWSPPGLRVSPRESEAGLGYRLSRVIQRAPALSLVVSLALVLVLAVPILRMRLGVSDDGNRPEAFTSRRAYDLLSRGFGPGFNGPILVAARIDAPAAATAIEDLPAELSALPGVANVSPVSFNAERSAALVTVIPATAPDSEETSELVHRLRDTLRQSLRGQAVEPLVGGPTAAFIDIGDKIDSRMLLFFPAIIGFSFLLLMAVFRSVLVPLKAAAMNLLSIGAAYGVIVAVFQWGWLGGILGVERQGPIESFLPMMMFRRALRPLDGLRGLPDQPYPGGVPADGQQRRFGLARALIDHAIDPGRRGDHDRRLPQLRLQRDAGDQGVWPGAGDRRVPRCHADPADPGAVTDAPARGCELVVPAMAGSAPAAHRPR